MKIFIADVLRCDCRILFWCLHRVSLEAITRSVHCKFNCVTVNFDQIQNDLDPLADTAGSATHIWINKKAKGEISL